MWNVKPTGVYETDYFQGILYADEVLAQIKNRSPNLIGVMANAMPKKYSGLEDGFFRTLTKALMQAA